MRGGRTNSEGPSASSLVSIPPVVHSLTVASRMGARLLTHLGPTLGLAISDVRHAQGGSAAAACVTDAVPRAAAHALAIEADAVGRLRRPCVATFSATLRCTCRASTRGRREERGGGSAPTRVLARLHWKHIQRTHRSAGVFVLGPSHTPPPLGWPAVATALPNRVPSTGFWSESPPRCLISRRLWGLGEVRPRRSLCFAPSFLRRG